MNTVFNSHISWMEIMILCTDLRARLHFHELITDFIFVTTVSLSFCTLINQQ